MVRCSKDRGEGGSVVRCSKDRGEGGSVVRCSKDCGEVQQRSWAILHDQLQAMYKGNLK